MTGDYVDIDLPGESWTRRGRLLAESRPDGSLPGLQIYDSFEYLLALRRHPDGRIEHEEIWRSDDPCDGKCLPVTPWPEETRAFDKLAQDHWCVRGELYK